MIHIKTFLKGLLATAIGILLTTFEFGFGLRFIGIIILLLILLLWIAANSVDAYRKLKIRVEHD